MRESDGPRAIVVVLDGCGAGAAPDAPEFGDHDRPATIHNVWNAVGGLNAPNLQRVGFFAACGVGGPAPQARYARLRPLGMGKDSVTGHWELMGATVREPFPTYPAGFPPDLVNRLEVACGTQWLGNRPASGTAIIAELGDEHVRTGLPILYTSADSVLQIAAHEAVWPIDRLYAACEAARATCIAPHNVQRVIARPFEGASGAYRRTERRKDFPLPAPANLLDRIEAQFGAGSTIGVGVVPELFAGRGFRPGPRTQQNAQHALALEAAMREPVPFIFANFEDFDMLYGHRNDVSGFAKCLEVFDQTLAGILASLRPSDLLILTADHGNDPTTPSTDHTREYVPMAVVQGGPAADLGDLEGLDQVGRLVAEHLGVVA